MNYSKFALDREAKEAATGGIRKHSRSEISNRKARSESYSTATEEGDEALSYPKTRSTRSSMLIHEQVDDSSQISTVTDSGLPDLGLEAFLLCVRCFKLIEICFEQEEPFTEYMNYQDVGEAVVIATTCISCVRAVKARRDSSGDTEADGTETYLKGYQISMCMLQGTNILRAINFLADDQVNILVRESGNFLRIESIEQMMRYVGEADRLLGIDSGAIHGKKLSSGRLYLPYFPGGFVV